MKAAEVAVRPVGFGQSANAVQQSGLSWVLLDEPPAPES
jgi:hypothetical protein